MFCNQLICLNADTYVGAPRCYFSVCYSVVIVGDLIFDQSQVSLSRTDTHLLDMFIFLIFYYCITVPLALY